MSDRSPAALTPQPDVPLWHNRYQAVRRLGQSEFCRTYQALDRADSSTCVVKQFSIANSDWFAGLEQLEHPQLPRLLDRFEQDGQILVYEWIEGNRLDAINSRFDEFRIRQLLLDLLPVLQVIHEQGWIHGDIKPENIILPAIDRLPMLVDLNAGVVPSNTGYAAPEQARGQAEAASDLFSLGLTCVHWLTNLHPFELYSDGASMWQQYLSEPISPALEKILDRLLQPNPRRRYQTAAAVLRDLRSHPVRSPSPIVRRQEWQCRQVLSGHTGEITALAVSPDGYFFASGSSDRTLKLWDVATGQLVHTFAGRSLWSRHGHRGCINALTFSPDGHLLISGSDDGTIKLWDLANQTCIETIDGHEWGVDALARSPQGSMLVSGGGDGGISLWDLDTGKLILRLGKHRDRVNAIVWSQDQQAIASASDDTTIRLWDLQRQQLVHLFSGHSASVRALAFSPNGQMLISGSDDKTLKFWQLERGELLTTVAAHADAIAALTVDAEAQLLASASADHTVKLWDLVARRRVATLRHDWSLSVIAFTPSGLLISGSRDETLRIWQRGA